VHRDIKPQNLLLTNDGVIKILDLGLARLRQADAGAAPAFGNLTREGIVIGTPDYLAPEQALDARSVDIRADIYSLGCTLYFLLTGQPPFPGSSVAQKLIKHQTEKPKSGEVLRPETYQIVGHILETMMAKKPADRYQTPADAAAALAPFGSR
jgi:serine/threonine protein kinase